MWSWKREIERKEIKIIRYDVKVKFQICLKKKKKR